jgi:MFS family permease
MVTSQMAAFAGEFGITKAVVWGFAALPLALTIDRFTNGLTRPFFGFVSDRIGRENTMTIAFALEGVAMALWLATHDNPVLFVLLSGVVFFGWGEIFSLFPSTLTDTFGTRNATRNYGCLYVAPRSPNRKEAKATRLNPPLVVGATLKPPARRQT